MSQLKGAQVIPLNANSTSTALSNGATFTGEWFNAIQYPNHETIIVTAKTDKAGILYVDFSPDGTNTDRALTFDVGASVSELHRLTIVNQYLRIRFLNNSGSTQAYLRIQTVLSNNSLMGIPLNVSMQSDTDAIPVKAVLHGETDGGHFLKVPVDVNGHAEIVLHGPLNPFGSLNVAQQDPVFQYDAVYGINQQNLITTTVGSGTATASNSAFECSTGTTIYSAGSITTVERLIYRAGQGVIGRFTGLWSTRVESSYSIIGYGHPEDGIFLGYVPNSVHGSTEFGILYGNRGVRETQTLTISTKSSTAENATVTLAGVAYSIAVTNGASTVTTAYEISKGDYGIAWRAEAIGSTVVFVANAVGNKTGTFSIAGTTVVGSFVETKAGVALTEQFIPQSSWNGDKLDGAGPSGIVADWQKFNVFQINIQYLGAGAITFFYESAPEGNNPTWIPFHSMQLPNTLTATTFGNPTFQFVMSAYSYGSTTNAYVKCGSFAGFNEGVRKIHGDRQSYISTSTGVGAGSYLPLFTIRNTRYFNGRSNQSVIKLLDVGAAIKHTSPVVIYLFKNATLTGSPNFAQHSATSCTYVDYSATACSISSNNQLIWSGPIGDTGNIDVHFDDEDIRLSPGDTITLAARSVTGTPSYVTGTLNTKEFQ